MPSIDAMLMTLAGRSGFAAARSGAASAWVRKNGDLTLRSITLSQPFSGKSSNPASHAAPALLTRMSSDDSRAAYAAASERAPSRLDTSIGSAMQVPPSFDSSAAVSAQASALRDEM